MERHFYGGIPADLNVPEASASGCCRRRWSGCSGAIDEAPVDLTLGGWGQDGHVAYNQARRHPFQRPSLEELAASTIRIQENNLDTIVALAQRTFGAAYQFVPPMSVTLGMRECLAAQQVRLFSDTGAWKQTALRVALFAEPTPEYPITLLQRHPDALLTATLETARHPDRRAPGVGAPLSPGVLRADGSSPYRRLVGVGGIGTGLFFALEGNHDLGRNESRPARLARRARLLQAAHRRPLPGGAPGARPSAFEVLPVGTRRRRRDRASACARRWRRRAWTCASCETVARPPDPPERLLPVPRRQRRQPHDQRLGGFGA